MSTYVSQLGPREAEQRFEALAKANRHRSAVARERRRIAALSMADASDALARIVEKETDPAILSGRVAHFLRAIPQRWHVEAIALKAGIADPAARLRDLTEGERAALAAELRRER